MFADVSSRKLLFRAAIFALVLLIPSLALGHWLLISFVHSSRPLAIVAEVILLPDTVFSLLFSQDTRSKWWLLVVTLQFLYLFALVYLILWAHRRVCGPVEKVAS